MPTQLDDLPDELLSMVIGHLADSTALPEWPYVAENGVNFERYRQRTLRGLRMASQRMKRLCTVTTFPSNPEVGCTLIMPGAWSYDMTGAGPGLYCNTTPTPLNHAMTHLEGLLETADFASAILNIMLNTPTLVHVLINTMMHEGHDETVRHIQDSFFQEAWHQTRLRSKGVPKLVYLRSFQLTTPTLSGRWEYIAPLMRYLRVQDLSISAHKFDSFHTSEFSRMPRLRRLHLSGQAVQYISNKWSTGDRYTMTSADQIKELWLSSFSKAAAKNQSPHKLFEALPRSIKKLVLPCTYAETVGWLASHLSDVQLWPVHTLKELRLPMLYEPNFDGRSHGITSTMIGSAVSNAHDLDEYLTDAGVKITPADWVEKVVHWIEEKIQVRGEWRKFLPYNLQKRYM